MGELTLSYAKYHARRKGSLSYCPNEGVTGFQFCLAYKPRTICLCQGLPPGAKEGCLAMHLYLFCSRVNVCQYILFPF